VPRVRQQRLKPAAGAAGAQVVAAKLFDEFDIAMNGALAALHARF